MENFTITNFPLPNIMEVAGLWDQVISVREFDELSDFHKEKFAEIVKINPEEINEKLFFYFRIVVKDILLGYMSTAIQRYKTIQKETYKDSEMSTHRHLEIPISECISTVQHLIVNSMLFNGICEFEPNFPWHLVQAKVNA